MIWAIASVLSVVAGFGQDGGELGKVYRFAVEKGGMALLSAAFQRVDVDRSKNRAGTARSIFRLHDAMSMRSCCRP